MLCMHDDLILLLALHSFPALLRPLRSTQSKHPKHSGSEPEKKNDTRPVVYVTLIFMINGPKVIVQWLGHFDLHIANPHRIPEHCQVWS